ncbi:hypothetical protein [Lacinutrix sp. MEBiC02404]
MLAHIPSHLSDLPIYKQALHIFLLSRSISTYLNQDLAYLKEDGSEDANIYFSGDIVRHSLSLAPEIINAEMERFSDKKHKHIASVRQLTNRLYSHCKRLEKCNSNGKEYIPILRRELKVFKKLQNSWMLTL